MDRSSTKAATGVAGLDDVLGGGLPRDRLYVVEGDPGVGKTTLALQFLLAGQAAGESTLYVSLSETEDELLQVTSSHGWSVEGVHRLELVPTVGLGGEEENTLFHPSEVELTETTRHLLHQVERWKPTRLVIDSLSELRLLAQTPLRYHRQILALKQYFANKNCTVLLLDDRSTSGQDMQIQSLAHGVVIMEQLSPLYGASRRRLRVQKLRGVRFRGGYHDFAIETGGLTVFPRLVAAEHRRPFPRESISTGVAELDRLMGGGLEPGTSLLVLGPSGSGKSVLTTQMAATAARAGHKGLFLLFDEGSQAFMRRGAALGIDLEREVAAGRIVAKQIDPAELSPGELTHTVREGVEKQGIRVVVIDGLNGYLQSMPAEQFMILQLHELLSYLSHQGVITILVVAQAGMVGPDMAAPVDISYLADAVILLRHFEANGRVRRALSMLKKRGGVHETAIREIIFGPQGMKVGEPLVGFQGVLAGTPRYVGDSAPLLAEAHVRSNT
jgi:circadian clock protein KaiC